jgi:hypothetical protein
LYDGRGEISKISINNGIMDSVVESGRPFGNYRPGESFCCLPFYPKSNDVRKTKNNAGLNEIS